MRACWIWILIALLTSVSCIDGGRGREELPMGNIEPQIGVPLQEKVVLLYASDGGGRDSSHGYYEWIFYSAEPMTFPDLKQSRLSMVSEVRMIEERLGSELISPQSLFLSNWRYNHFDYRANVVHAPDGYYAMVMRTK